MNDMNQCKTNTVAKDIKVPLQIINVTPHEVCIYLPDMKEGTQCSYKIVRIPPSGLVVRCREEVTASTWVPFLIEQGTNEIDIPLMTIETQPLVNLPEPQQGVLYLVSRAVAEAVKTYRKDVVIPYDAVRNEAGQIIGCRGLAVVI